MDIINDISLGEGKQMEFKSKIPSGNQIAKTLIAFSNQLEVNLLLVYQMKVK